MNYPYDIKGAEIDKQDMEMLAHEIEEMSEELRRRSKVKNILLLHLMITSRIEHELKFMPEKERRLCIKEIRGTLVQRIPDLFSQEETLWCLWKHFKSFLEQSIEEKTADFGKPCSDCKLWDSCKGNWLGKIGKSKPSEITINRMRETEEENEEPATSRIKNTF